MSYPSPPTRQRTPNPIPRTALVTGAGRRVGRAIALNLAQAGWDIAIHYGHSENEAEALAETVQGLGRRTCTVQADLSQEHQTAALIPAAVTHLGPIGLLVNNASVFEPDRLATATRSSWDKHLETNLRAPVVLMQAFAEQLPIEHDGAIVNILDQRVWNAHEDFLSYTLTKTGLWSLTRTLALDLAPRIRVNGVGPGPVLPSIHQTDDSFEREAASTPLQHGADAEEIAAAVHFLATARSVTGQMIAVDSGQHLWWAPPGRDTA